MLAAIDLSNPSNVMAAVAVVMPVLLGGVTTWLNIFIDPQREFRSRIDQKRAELIEGVAVQHAFLLNQCRNYDNDLRGDGRNEPDLVGEYTGRLFKLFVIFHRLELLKLVVRCAYWALFALIALGVLGFLCNLLFDETRQVVLWYGVVAVLIELSVIGVVFATSQKLEQYEDVT